MAKAILGHNPSLTKEKLKEILSSHFSPLGYEVDFFPSGPMDVYVNKDILVGAAIKLKQRSNSTYLQINGYAPSGMRCIFGIIFLIPKWFRFEKEVKEFVTSGKFQSC